MKRQKLWLYALMILTIQTIMGMVDHTTAKADANVKAVSGQLHIEDKPISEAGPYKLNGEWEFYWQELLTPEDFNGDIVARPKSIVIVPDTWSRYSLSEQRLPQFGYATYRLTVNINDADVGKLISIYVPNIASAYRLWANDQFLTSQGTVAQSREEMRPKNYGKVTTFIVDSPKIEFLLQVSNYNQRKAGLWEPLTFGTAEQVGQLRDRNILLQIFVVGCIFIIGFYHLVMFFQRPKELSFLFLAIACFGITLRTLLLKDTLLVYIFPQISWELAVTLEYFSALIALLCFLLFVKQELSKDVPNGITNVFVVIVSLYSLFVLFTPARIFTNTFLFFQILAFIIMLKIVIVSFMGVKKRREGAYLNLIAMLVLFIAILNDLLYYSSWISTDEFVSLGLLFYLFTQSVHLARRSSRSFDKVEKLSEELQTLNHSLELKVEKRTKELREANRSLQKIEQARRRLLASVSHELKTPLTFIQGYIKAMIDGVISKDDSTYLRAVYRDTQMMAHMIHDLQELSRLESGQVTFQYSEIEMRTFLRQLFEEQKPIIEGKGLCFQYEEKLNYFSAQCEVICSVDPVRLKQAYLNFIVNAEKFTAAKGTIKIKVEIPPPNNRQQIKISVIDTGAGIAEKDLPFIFERFYKANQLDGGNKKGAGLGLAIAKEIIEYHHGIVGVNSEQGNGSEFYFLLPIKEILQGKDGER